MSTGENINANGAVLSADMIRAGFTRFPQTTVCYVNRIQWVLIPPIQIAVGSPFTILKSQTVPTGEIWFVGPIGETLGRIVNIGNP